MFPRSRGSFALALFLAAGLGILIERLVVTDEEAIIALLEDGVKAVKEGDLARLRPLLSDEFTWGGEGPDSTLRALQRLLDRYSLTRIDASFGAVIVARDRAELDVDLRVWTRAGIYPGRLRVSLARESPGWRILGANGFGG